MDLKHALGDVQIDRRYLHVGRPPSAAVPPASLAHPVRGCGDRPSGPRGKDATQTGVEGHDIGKGSTEINS
jgi:hypothetical protein